MRSFQHTTPALRLFSGSDSLSNLGRELDRLNSRRAMVFCGSHFSPDKPPLNSVLSAIGERCAGVFSEVLGHSPLPSVETAAQELKRAAADAVIAVGGGSAIVTARAAAILAAEDCDARSLCTSRDKSGGLKSPKLLAPKLPQLVVPTSPTTATVKAGSAIFDPASGERLALYDPKTRAQSVFVHPELIGSAPRGLVVSASLNALSMAIEGLVSGAGDPISDALLMHALRLLEHALRRPQLLDDPTTRGDLVHAAILCGQGTDYTGAGMTTVLGHAIGARYELENGIVNAIVLPHVLRFNGASAERGLQKVVAAMALAGSDGPRLTTTTINGVLDLFDQLDVPGRLREVEVPQESLGEIAESAMGDWFLGGNPRPVRSVSELREVLEDSW